MIPAQIVLHLCSLLITSSGKVPSPLNHYVRRLNLEVSGWSLILCTGSEIFIFKLDKDTNKIWISNLIRGEDEAILVSGYHTCALNEAAEVTLEDIQNIANTETVIEKMNRTIDLITTKNLPAHLEEALANEAILVRFFLWTKIPFSFLSFPKGIMYVIGSNLILLNLILDKTPMYMWAV